MSLQNALKTGFVALSLFAITSHDVLSQDTLSQHSKKNPIAKIKNQFLSLFKRDSVHATKQDSLRTARNIPLARGIDAIVRQQALARDATKQKSYSGITPP